MTRAHSIFIMPPSYEVLDSIRWEAFWDWICATRPSMARCRRSIFRGMSATAR